MLSDVGEPGDDERIEVAQRVASRLLGETIGKSIKAGVPPFDVWFAMWHAITAHLVDCGWTAEELTHDVQVHVAMRARKK
jgi:hypothetical protein